MNTTNQIATYNLNITDYCYDKDNLPKYNGIYFVYRAQKNQLVKLIYIGKADDQTIYQRHHPHEKQEQFDKQLQEGEKLCYLTVEIDRRSLDCIENGLIYYYKPSLNDELKDHYKHQDAKFILGGLLNGNFMVKNTETE